MYSFGIIAQEIILRKETFYTLSCRDQNGESDLPQSGTEPANLRAFVQDSLMSQISGPTSHQASSELCTL